MLRFSPTVIYSLKPAAPARCTFASENFKAIFGHQAKELVGDPDFWQRHLHPDDALKMADRFEKLLKSGHQCVEYRFLHKDGSYRWIYDSARVIHDPLGAEPEVIGSLTDISGHKRDEEALAHDRDLLQSLMDNLPDYIYFKDVSSRFIRINRAHAQHFNLRNPEEAIGKSDADYFTPLEARQKLTDEQVLMATGKPVLGLIEKVEKADGVHWFSSTKVPIYGADGKVTGLVGISRDITAEKQAELERQTIELQLRQSQKLESIGQLAAGIAHEINTPTQYVGDNTRFLQDSFKQLEPLLKSHAELVRAAKAGSLTPDLLARAEETLRDCDLDYLFAQIPAAINETLEGIGRVTKIVRAMKEFSHPGGKEKTAADINKAIESTATVARNEWKYVAELKLDLAPDLPFIPCYLGEFNQAVLNLIVNASHAIADVVKGQSNTRGLITISTRRDGDTVEIRVSDTGTGIPEQVRPHIFEPFFTTKGVGKGSGQGLSIVYGSIVKRHGGAVDFQTEMGRGTTFILRLPISPNP